MLAYESKVQPSVKCLLCCVKFSLCKIQTLNTPMPGTAGSPETEKELKCSWGQVEPATGTDTFKWENNSTVQSVRVILTLRVQDYLRKRHISPPLARADVQKCVCAARVARFFFHGSYLLPHGADQLLILLPAVASFSLELEFHRLQLTGHGSLHLHCLHVDLTEDTICYFKRGEN